MSINLSDELHAATTKGKIASAKEVYLDGDKENLQQVGEKTHQLEEAVADISVTGGASTAHAVSYDNKTSGMTSVTAQGAIDELAAKDKSQDAEIAKKANTSDVDSKMQEGQTRVNAELDKKFDKENIAQELGDSEDKVVSQFALPFRIEESEEFLYLIKDGEDHVLFGIQQDGSIEWQVGIPSPIRAKIQEIISQSQQDKTDLSDALNAAKSELNAALQAYKQTTDAAITSLQDTKVDKEEGKSLIDDEVKAHFEVIESDEWFNAMVDEENHILFGIKRDTGKPYFPLNEMYHVEQNEEFFALWLDADNRILMGIRRDGQIIGEIHAVNALKESISAIQSNIETLQGSITSIGDKVTSVEGSISTLNTKVSTIDSSLKELLSVISIQNNPEFMAVETDADGRILASTNADGSHYSYNLKSETLDKKQDKEDGRGLIDSNVAEANTSFEDVEERMSIETDAEGKIMAYRDKEGMQHENELNAKTLHVSNLNLKDNSVNDIQSALIANGFNIKTPIDWSNYLSNNGKNPLYIPEPRCARVNISGIEAMPTSKAANNKAYFEMWDMQGNYFKKKVIVNAQGNTTMQYPKKSFACDFFDDDWDGDAFSMKIGDWVPQDSFHFKAQYTDFFKGVSIVAYKIVQEVWASRSPIYGNPWKKALLAKQSITSGSYDNQGINDLSLQKDTGAKCVPDAFPCVVYLNGEFYGLFNWALKKHRDNYHMDKSSGLHIHIDGGSYPFLTTLDWTKFEVRNPKGLLTNVVSGSGFEKYDGDSPKELLGKETVGYDASNKTHKLSNQVKEAVVTFNSLGRTLNALDKEEGDKFLAEHYDLDNLIDCYVMQYVFADEDEENNWQWVTYDGKRWYVCEYDKDRTFGQTYHCRGVRPANSLLNRIDINTDNYPFKFLYTYHKAEIKKRYEELKSIGIFTPEHIISLLENWVDRFSSTDFKLEYKKWSESPSNRDDLVDREHWKVKSYSYATTNNYDNTKTYNVGDTCIYGKLMHTEFECIKESTGYPPQTGYYNELPYDMGYHDSIWRAIKYITERFQYIEENINNLV